MASFLRSKKIGLFVIAAIIIAVYAGWQLTTMPQGLQGYFNSAPIEGTASPRDENTPSMDSETPAAATEDNSSEDSDSEGATADGVNDFGACEEEGKTHCSGFYTSEWQTWAEENGYTSASWKLGLVDCLGQQEALLSQACKDSLDRRQTLNEELNAACRNDRATYCAGVEPSPGSEPQVECLLEHYDELSAECAEAVDAHEAAKPL